jgi:tetratricopeptide (TPR) repeat protein
MESRFRFGIFGSLTLGAALALPMPAMAQSREAWIKCVNQGRVYSFDIQVQSCTDLIRSGQETRHDTAAAFDHRGFAYYVKRDLDHAIEDFNQAIALDPGYSEPYDGRASAYSDKGDHGRALSDLNEAIRLDPKNVTALSNICDELLIVGQPQAALADCNEALNLQPDRAVALVHRGNVYLRLGKWDQAIADYDTVLHVQPKDFVSLYGRGLAKQKKGDVAGGDADMASAKAVFARIGDVFALRGIK